MVGLTALTQDPAVTAWRMALAPRPRAEPTGRHWWREYVIDVLQHAEDAWQARRESSQLAPAAYAGGGMVACHQLEDDDYAAAYPRPTLKGLLSSLSGCQSDPYEHPPGSR